MVEKVVIECPFCGKSKISAIYIPPILISKTGRASSNKKTVFFKSKEKYEVQSSCPHCGKKAKDIEKAFKEGKKDAEK